MTEENEDLGQEPQQQFSRWGRVYVSVVLFTVLVIYLLYAFSANYSA